MEHYYIILVGILFIFAVFNLVVGVSNDAANFLSSAIGAKAAPFWVVILIASFGILGGVLSSDGMMEVVRSGIFIPSMFSFHDIMIIFIAVMITNVLLFEAFNTLGLPTSTTVSIVFELLGGAVAIAVIRLNTAQQPLMNLFEYINTANAIRIIIGIFTSIIVAFFFGLLVQWIVRFIFSFNYEKAMQRFGSLFGGIAITVLVYFMIIKGAKHAQFLTDSVKDFIQENMSHLWIYSIIVFTIIIKLLQLLFKINVLKLVVLVGTFALALAFAGNDLVNFIGVPLAGLHSFQVFMTNGAANDTFAMDALMGNVVTPSIFLLIAGMIMVLTLWLSKKAKHVTQTTINLSDQSQGPKQFGSSLIARIIVRSATRFSERVSSFVPQRIAAFVNSRFQPKDVEGDVSNVASFDLLRASINLMVASMLITVGTSYKLPLSTTYVIFMVAMASSFADGAWGRESAVYRITGVLTVISGWFLTAFIAFITTAIMVFVINKGEMYALIPLIFITLFVITRSQIFKSQYKKKQDALNAQKIDVYESNIVTRSFANVNSVLLQINDIISQVYAGFDHYNHHELKRAKQRAKQLDANAKDLKDNVNVVLQEISTDNLEVNYNYVQLLDYLREMARSLTFIANPSFTHVNNNHRPLIDEQKVELHDIKTQLNVYFNAIIENIESQDFSSLELIADLQAELFETINKTRKKQMKRMKSKLVNTRNSLLYLQLLHEMKQIISYSMNAFKSHRDLVVSYNS
ncbi:MAG: phosphate permease [Bacteroidales bacterium]|nr:phosphate permease [Bacteroidales bacterium]